MSAGPGADAVRGRAQGQRRRADAGGDAIAACDLRRQIQRRSF
jgi:hypothetical protein